jgi:hypothetical protein
LVVLRYLHVSIRSRREGSSGSSTKLKSPDGQFRDKNTALAKKMDDAKIVSSSNGDRGNDSYTDQSLSTQQLQHGKQSGELVESQSQVTQFVPLTQSGV